VLVRAVSGGGRRRRETVAGDGAAGDRLVHLLLLGREVGGRDQVAQFTAVPAAAVTVLVVHLLVIHRLEYLNMVNKNYIPFLLKDYSIVLEQFKTLSNNMTLPVYHAFVHNVPDKLHTHTCCAGMAGLNADCCGSDCMETGRTAAAGSCCWAAIGGVPSDSGVVAAAGPPPTPLLSLLAYPELW
jgi:hypothetical protein